MTRRPRKQTEPLDEGALYEYAVKALGRGMRSTREMEKLMLPRVEGGERGGEKIAAVIRRLKDRRYLDDDLFALAYARLRRENQGFGRRRVEREMAQRGVASEPTARALDAAYEDTDEEALARGYLARKRLPKPATPSETARIVRRLAAAGFSFSVIAAILKNWGIVTNEEDLAAPEN